MGSYEKSTFDCYAPREELDGLYLDAVTREGFNPAHEISSYSFAALARSALPMMQGRKAALLTLTYIGSQRSMPAYPSITTWLSSWA